MDLSLEQSGVNATPRCHGAASHATAAASHATAAAASSVSATTQFGSAQLSAIDVQESNSKAPAMVWFGLVWVQLWSY